MQLDKISADFFQARTNKNLEAINEARTQARTALFDLLTVMGDYLHPAYAPKRTAYFEAVQRYADLTDQTFESAIAAML